MAVCLLLLGRSASSSFVDHQKRMEFIQAMDKATRPTKDVQDFHQRLLAKARPVPSRILEQNDDDDDAANDDQYVENRLDLENYALKYAGCQNIKTWSDNKAQDEDSDTVFTTNRFVVFRMCPADHCSTYNSHGCNNNYGEYMITMEDYLAIMAQYHYARFHEYCATCQACMSYEEQLSSYQNTQQNNGGRKLNNNVRRLADDDYYAYQGDDQVNNDDAGDDGGAQNDDDDGGYNDDQAAAGDDAAGDDAGGDDAAGDDQYAYQQADDYVANDDVAAGDDQVQNGDDGGGDDNVYADDQAYNNADDDGNAGDDGYADDIAVTDDAADDATTDDFYAYIDDDTYKDDDAAGGRYSNCGLSTCYNYQSVCGDYSANGAELSNYFACSQFVVGNQVVYIGPHCKDDGHGITLGLFEDYECSSYLGSITNLQEFTGINFEEDSLSFYYPKTCVSCANQVRTMPRGIFERGFLLLSNPSCYSLFDNQGEWTLQNGNYGGDANAYDLCETLYDTSAKCHEHLSSSSSVYEVCHTSRLKT